MCSSPKSPTMELNEQSQPKLKASMTTQNVGTFKNPKKQKEEEEEQQGLSINAAKNGNRKEDYLDSLPPGYRFCPYDHELVVHYLKNKVLNDPVPHNKIREVNLYLHNPEDLAEKYEVLGEKEWYFFTPRDRKYRNGTRPNRAAGNGYWKATGADKDVKFKGVTVGYRKALVFYKGKPPKGDKTNWIMHEYRVRAPPTRKRDANDMRLDDWVLCRIYKKAEKIDRSEPQDDVREPDVHSTALSDEGSPIVMNENDPNCDCNHNIGHSSALINTNSDYLQSPFQIRVPEIPHFDASLPNATNSLLQPSFNYEARPISYRPPVYSAENIFRSKHLKEDGWSSKPKGLQEDNWGSTNLDNCDLSSLFDFSNTGIYMDPFLNLDTILPSNAPDYPPMPTSG